MALPPETERMLIALQAFLDAPPPPCYFRCTRCHHYVTSDLNLIQIRQYADHHPVIRQGQFVLACGGAGLEPVFPTQNFL
uniref:Yippee domain-containing protein n=1 Tax=Vitis vinifera TaxID=29760 RepID=F6GV97_VITVI